MTPNAPMRSAAGQTLMRRGQAAQALDHFSHAAAISPKIVVYQSNMSIAMRELGRLDEATATCRRALLTSASDADVLVELADGLLQAGEAEGAVEQLRAAVAARPDDASIGSACFLHCIIIRRSRRRSSFRNISTGPPDMPRRSNRHYKTRQRSRTDRPLRIGYVSANFRDNGIGRFIEPIVAGHQAKEFAVCCYSDSAVEDSATRRMREHAAVWHDVRGRTDEQMIAMIREDRIDILVDLDVHRRGNRLPVFAAKPAPVQMTYLSYPGTTGLRAVDFKITDAQVDPSGQSKPFNAERFARLDGGYFCYPEPPDSREMVQPPAIAAGQVTFASFAPLSKVNDRVLQLWSRLLAQVPGSRLVIATTPLRVAASVEQRIFGIFAAADVSVDRIQLIPSLDSPGRLARFNEVDIALDPFPFNAARCACDGLWMGVPLITLAGAHGVSRWR